MNLSPLPIQKFFDNNGRPLVGGLLFTYEAGTNNKIATYKDESGLSVNTNPIVLDFRGEANVWLDPELTYKFVLSPKDDTDPPSNPIWSVDDIASGISYAYLTRQFIGRILFPRTDAEITANVTPINYFFPEGHLYRYGTNSVPGVTDMKDALDDAFSLSGVAVFIPGESQFFSANLRVPVCGSITGAGFALSRLIAGSGVTLGIDLTTTSGITLADFAMYGNATASAVGIVLGAVSLTGNVFMYAVQVWQFTGANAIGVQAKDCVIAEMRDCYFAQSTINLLVGGGNAFLPTVVHMYGGSIQQATTCGAKIVEGYSVAFYGVTFESNAQEGILVETSSGRRIEDLLLESNCWFEANWSGHVDTGTLVFNIRVDGTSGAYTNVNMSDIRISMGATVASDIRGIKIKNAIASLSRLRMYQGYPFSISIEGSGCLITVQDDSDDRMARFISNPDAATVRYPLYSQVIEVGDGTSLLPGTWRAYTPAYSSSSGNQAATFSGGTVTTTLARYVLNGKMCTITAVFSGTLNAVTPSYLALSLPFTPANSNNFGGSLTTDAGTSVMAPLQTNTNGTIRLYKNPGGTNYTSGAAVSVAFSATYETA